MFVNKVRIKNFRSIDNLEVTFLKDSVFIGSNNSGKSNILLAISKCLNRYSSFDELDIHFYKENDYKDIVIDVMLSPDSDDFSAEWYLLLGENISLYKEKYAIMIRTQYKYDTSKESYVTKKYFLSDWSNITAVDGKSVPADFFVALPCFYISSDRDISRDIRVRKSNFSKLMKSVGMELTDDVREEIEEDLTILNNKIAKNLPKIKNVENALSGISSTLNYNERITVQPIPSSVTDMEKGVELFIENASNKLPAMQFGDGTRSWLSLLTLKAYIELIAEDNHSSGYPFKAIILLEEPESHLHPQGQRSAYKQLESHNSHILMTSHSNNILMDFDLDAVFLVTRYNGNSVVKSIEINDYDETEIHKIKTHILETKGDMLFARKVILVEGLTETILVSGLYKEFKGSHLFEDGYCVVRVDGFKSFLMFSKFLTQLGIEHYIYSDLDDNNPKRLRKLFSRHNSDFDFEDNVFFTQYKNMEYEILESNFRFALDFYLGRNKTVIEERVSLSWQDTDDLLLSKLSKFKTVYPYEFLKGYNDNRYVIPRSIYRMFYRLGR